MAAPSRRSVDGFALDFIDGGFDFGVAHLSDNAVALFTDEYRLPWVSPTIAAYAAAIAESLFSTMLLLGLGIRIAALGLLSMTLVIEIFVDRGAWPTHGTWAAILLYLVARGPDDRRPTAPRGAGSPKNTSPTSDLERVG